MSAEIPINTQVTTYLSKHMAVKQFLLLAIGLAFTIADSVLGLDISDVEMGSLYSFLAIFGLAGISKKGFSLSQQMEGILKVFSTPQGENVFKKLLAKHTK